ncbi:MAG: hypothetical protein ACI4U9_00380, partial [Clostridia bacterium]
TRPDVETNTSWQKAKDAEYTLTITEHCTAHVKPEEPKDPEDPEKPDEPGDNEIGNNVDDGNNTVVDGNNTVDSNTVDENVVDGNNTTDNEAVNNTTE